MRRKLIFIIPAVIAGIAIVAFIGGEIVMQLWNRLLPPLFGWHEVTFWQALGLLVLCRILFGGAGRHLFNRPGGNIRRRMADRWERMSPDERERFRHGMSRCGFDHPTHDAKPE